MMDFYSESRHKSRKERECECCGKTIKVGEIYSQQRGKYYGDFFSRDLCLTCEGAINSYCCEVDNEFSYDAISEYAQESVCSSCPECVDGIPECEHLILRCPKVSAHFVKTPSKGGAI